MTYHVQVLFVGPRLPYVLASVGADGYLRLWNAKQLQLLAQVLVSTDGLTAVCVDPGQLRLAVADASGNIYIYCIAKWKQGRSKQPVSPHALSMDILLLSFIFTAFSGLGSVHRRGGRFVSTDSH